MAKKKNSNIPDILFIDPFSSIHPKNTAGIAYVRGFLEDNKISTGVINFNYVIDNALFEKFITAVKDFLDSNNIYSSDKYTYNYDTIIYYLLVRLYYFGPDLIWRAVDQISVFDKLFAENLKIYKNIEYIGISITYSKQVLFSLMLAGYIKRKLNSNIKIIFGGSLVTACQNDFIELLQKDPIVDYLIVGEGETPLLGLISGSKPEKIPNLIYLKGKGYKFSDDLHHYENFLKPSNPIFEPGDTLFLQYARKCYWGKCSFCTADHYHFDRKYTTKRVEQIIGNLKANNIRTGDYRARCIFVDSALPKDFILDFHKQASKEPIIDNKFSGYLRSDNWVDHKILEIAKEMGIVSFGMGIETFNRRLQKILNKGYEPKQIWKIFENCRQLDIKIAAFFMVALPTQTETELVGDLKKIKKLLDNFPNIDKVELVPLSVKINTPLYNFPEKFKIRILKKSKIFLFDHFSFQQLEQQALSQQKALLIANDYIDNEMSKYKNKIQLWY